ncbi:hypothetical protein [Rhodobacter sp. 24-YEA-8]|uniref:hypothetical protein n=1 Tax=Rhodobacter sp. 24-YEA-8 TaxID=1884310 RepID=UPI001495E131|nr:hypothetical protein [Rhodobacter sp. 24-YEA-8]
MSSEIFDHLPDGRPVKAARLRGAKLSATLLTMGATVQDLQMERVAHPLVPGFPTLALYPGKRLCVGAFVWRSAVHA